MKEIVQLARKAVESFVRKKEKISCPEDLSPPLLRKAGVFVTIKKGDELRGCIGTPRPTEPNLAEETVANAVAACSRDLRFPSLEKEDLPALSYEVYVLEKPERVESLSALDPDRYGIIVKSGARSGLLLPGLSGIETSEKQFRLACRKARLEPDPEEVRIFRFEAEKYEEE